MPESQALSNPTASVTEIAAIRITAISSSAQIGGKKYTPKVFSALKTQEPEQAKKRLGVYQKACFQGKRRKIHIHQRAFEAVVGGPFAQYWCIDLGLLHRCTLQPEKITYLHFCVRICYLEQLHLSYIKMFYGNSSPESYITRIRLCRERGNRALVIVL